VTGNTLFTDLGLDWWTNGYLVVNLDALSGVNPVVARMRQGNSTAQAVYKTPSRLSPLMQRVESAASQERSATFLGVDPLTGGTDPKERMVFIEAGGKPFAYAVRYVPVLQKGLPGATFTVGDRDVLVARENGKVVALLMPIALPDAPDISRLRARVQTSMEADAVAESAYAPPGEKSVPVETAVAEPAGDLGKQGDSIVDVGEKLGGARKDAPPPSLTRDITDDDMAAQPLSIIWPASEIVEEQDLAKAALYQALRDEVPAKPKKDYRVREWVDKVKQVRALAVRVSSGELSPDAIKEQLRKQGTRLSRIADKAELLLLLPRDSWKRVGQVEAHEGAYRYGPDNAQIATPMVNVSVDGYSLTVNDPGEGGGTSIERVAPAIIARLGVAAPVARMRFEVRGRSTYSINKEGDRLYRKLKTFPTAKEALNYVREHHAELVAAWEEVAGKNKPEVRRTLNPDAQRQGPDRRSGVAIAAEDFRSTFGFRGVEFGNWTNQADRQQSVDQAYDGLMDLSALLRVPPAALSLDGRLGLAFGARGGGRMAGHYEPGREVINLTRTKGEGILAHEWAHAFDNYFGKMATPDQIEAYASGGVEVRKQAAQDVAGKSGVRPEVAAAWLEVRTAIGDAKTYKGASSAKDSTREKGYWTRPTELFARSFEVWTAQRLEDAGQESPYLVQGVPTAKGEPAEAGSIAWEWHQLYPQKVEAERISAAIDHLAATLKTETTERGTTRLFGPDNIPGDGESERLRMPAADEGIESLISWALQDRQQTIERMRKKVALGGSQADQYREILANYEGVDPGRLATDMRLFPQHYIRSMGERGGHQDAVGAYRNRVERPAMQPRPQVAPLAVTAGQVPNLAQTLKDLAKDLRKADGRAPTFDVQGSMQNGGEFNTRTGGIATKHHNDLDTVSHEIGHFASETFRVMPEPGDTETRAELARLSVHGSPATGETAQREGMAEAVRAWMVNPEEALRVAPRFVARFESMVSPKVLAALQAYGQDVRRFMGASALQREAAGMRTTGQAIAEQKREGRWYAPIVEGVRQMMGKGIGQQKSRSADIPDKWESSKKATFHIADKEAPQLANYLLALAMVGRDPSTMKPGEHWDFLRKGMRGVAAKIRDGMSMHGLPNPDGTVAVDDGEGGTGEPITLPWLMEDAAKQGDGAAQAAFLDKTWAYGSAQRTIELANRFTLKTENDIQRVSEQEMRGAGNDHYQQKRAAEKVAEYAATQRKALRQQLARLTASGGGIQSAVENARAAVAEAGRDPRHAAMTETLRRYRRWSDWNLGYAVQSELMSPTQAATIRQANQFYIDWHRVFADDDGPVQLGEAVSGSSRTIHNPLASLLHTTYSTISRGDRNQSLLTFVAPLRLAPVPGATRSLSSLGRIVPKTEADEALTRQHGKISTQDQQQQRLYPVQRVEQEADEEGAPLMDADGTPIQKTITEWWVFDPATEASMEAMRAETASDTYNKIMRGLVNLQRMAIVTSPSFRLKVPVRDNVERIMNSAVGSGVADTAYGFGKTLRDPHTGEELDLERLYTQSGTAMAGWNRRSREQATADILAHLEDMHSAGWRVLTPGGAWRAWQRFGETTENVARKAEFARAFIKARKDMGYSQQDAALYAMTQSRGLLDTAESGHMVGGLNRYFLFLNAQIKGLERTTLLTRQAAGAWKRGDVATATTLTKTLASRMAMLGGTFAVLRLMMLAMLNDDDQEQLLAAPSWKRDFAVLVPDFGIGPIAIPKPYEWGLIGSGFERAADAMWATAKAEEATGRGDTESAQRWREHASRAGDGYGQSALTALLPTKFDDLVGTGAMPLAEVLMNRSTFTGGTIIPHYEEGRRLALRKRAQDASALSRGLSAVSSWAVGDKFGDPRAIDHILRGYLGGWGSAITGAKGQDVTGDFAEVLRRLSGYSGQVSTYSSRDVSFVLDESAAQGVDGKGLYQNFRKLIKAVKAAEGTEKDRLETILQRQAMALRSALESPGETGTRD
jgi:hypothetical protein